MMCWTRPFPAVKAALREAYEVGLASGDLIYAVYSAVTKVFFMVLAGDPLSDLCARCEVLVPARAPPRPRRPDRHPRATCCTCSAGCCARPTDLDHAMTAEDAAIRATISDERTPLAMFYYHLYRAMQLYMFADYPGAHAALRRRSRGPRPRSAAASSPTCASTSA